MSGCQMCRALYDFEPVEEGDLPFKEGSIVWFLSQDSDDPEWWYGQCDDKRGQFPMNYVEVLSVEEQQAYEAQGYTYVDYGLNKRDSAGYASESVGADSLENNNELYGDGVDQQYVEGAVAYWNVGDSCEALWEQDGGWYGARIDGYREDTGEYLITFVEYGNQVYVSYGHLRRVGGGTAYAATSPATSPQPEASGIPIPKELESFMTQLSIVSKDKQLSKEEIKRLKEEEKRKKQEEKDKEKERIRLEKEALKEKKRLEKEKKQQEKEQRKREKEEEKLRKKQLKESEQQQQQTYVEPVSENLTIQYSPPVPPPSSGYRPPPLQTFSTSAQPAPLSPEDTPRSREDKRKKTQAILDQFENNVQLEKQGRFIVSRGQLWKKGRFSDKKYYYFLFTDILVECEFSTKSGKFKTRKTFDIDVNFQVVDIPDAIGEKENRFEVTHSSSQKKFVVYSQTEQEKEGWIEDLQKLCRRIQSLQPVPVTSSPYSAGPVVVGGGLGMSPRTGVPPRPPPRAPVDTYGAQPTIGQCDTTDSTTPPVVDIDSKIIKDWSVDDVLEWLKRLKFDDYKTTFQEHSVDGELLLTLTNDELKDCLKIDKPLHLKRFDQKLTALEKTAQEQEPTFQNFSVPPEMIKQWNIDTVQKYLQDIGLDIYCKGFESQGVDGLLLLTLSEDDLKKHMNVNNKLHLRKFNLKLKRLSEIAAKQQRAYESLPVPGVLHWGVGQVLEWLSKSGFQKYTKDFDENKVDGELLLSLEETDLKNEMSFKEELPLRRIQLKISHFRQRLGLEDASKSKMNEYLHANSHTPPPVVRSVSPKSSSNQPNSGSTMAPPPSLPSRRSSNYKRLVTKRTEPNAGVPAPSSSKKMFCSSCSIKRQRDISIFCPNCGKKY